MSAMACSISPFAIHEPPRSRYEVAEDAREFLALTFAGAVTGQNINIKAREIFGLSIVSPFYACRVAVIGKTGGAELFWPHARLRMGLFWQTGFLAHSAADGTLSAAAKSSDHVRHFLGKF